MLGLPKLNSVTGENVSAFCIPMVYLTWVLLDKIIFGRLYVCSESTYKVNASVCASENLKEHFIFFH